MKHKIVKIKRSVEKGGLESKDYIYINEKANQHIGSYLKRNTNGSVGSGLNIEETKLLMPFLINREPSDMDFWDLVKDYFITIRTTIPNTGLELNISLQDDNLPLGELTEEGKPNLPINVDNYVKYRHALSHPKVAKDLKQDRKKGFKTQFYVEDPQEQQLNIKTNLEVKTHASNLYANIIKNEIEKVPYVLTMLGVFLDKELLENEALQWQKLNELKDEKPNEFIKIVEDKRLENKYKIKTLINHNKFKRVGNKIITDNDDPTGANTIDELATIMEEDEKINVMVNSYYEDLKLN